MRNHRIQTSIPLFAMSLLTLFSCGESKDNLSESLSTKESATITSIDSSESSFSELFTITWKNYDGTILEIDENVKKGTIPTFDGATPTRESDTHFSYVFSGWTPEVTKVSQDQTYTALYSSEKIQYSITYNLKGGVNDPSNPASYTSDDSFVFKDATRVGYTFLNWLNDENGRKITSIQPGQMGPLVLSALWNEGNEYTVTLDPNGGMLLQNQFDVQYDHGYALPIPSKDGFAFDGWYDKENKIENQGLWNIADNKTLIAKWFAEYYEIVYHLDGGQNNPGNPETYTIEHESISLKDASRDGYSFTGWFSDSSFDNRIISIPKGSKGELHLFAKWDVITYEIHYDLNGGTMASENPLTYTIEEEIQLLEPTKDGYFFTGWLKERETISTIKQGTFGDLTLVAQWSPYKYGLIATTTNMERGSVEIIAGEGYADETITIVATPKEGYLFEGWYENGLTRINGKQTYSFTMPHEDVYLSGNFVTEAEHEEILTKKYGKKPVLSDDGKTLTYGLYPQTNVNDKNLVASLNEIEQPEANGWYLYEEDYYAKVVASPYSNSYQFVNGDTIVKDETYWFKCEPIEWDVLTDNSGEIQLLSHLLLDNHEYNDSTSNRTIDGKTVYATNYEFSSIRSWLNNEFYNTAFSFNPDYIQKTTVDNSKESGLFGKEMYASNDTLDYVFLLSDKEYMRTDFGFEATSEESFRRYCKTTDYARAKGIYYYPSAGVYSQYCGAYWTRSPTSAYTYYAQEVNVDGRFVISQVDSMSSGVRPSIVLKMY